MQSSIFKSLVLGPCQQYKLKEDIEEKLFCKQLLSFLSVGKILLPAGKTFRKAPVNTTWRIGPSQPNYFANLKISKHAVNIFQTSLEFKHIPTRQRGVFSFCHRLAVSDQRPVKVIAIEDISYFWAKIIENTALTLQRFLPI